MQLKTGTDEHGNFIISIGDEAIALPPHSALKLAASICATMCGHFTAPEPAPPSIVQPNHRLILPE